MKINNIVLVLTIKKQSKCQAIYFKLLKNIINQEYRNIFETVSVNEFDT
jgi:hypothetical protein